MGKLRLSISFQCRLEDLNGNCHLPRLDTWFSLLESPLCASGCTVALIDVTVFGLRIQLKESGGGSPLVSIIYILWFLNPRKPFVPARYPFHSKQCGLLALFRCHLFGIGSTRFKGFPSQKFALESRHLPKANTYLVQIDTITVPILSTWDRDRLLP